MAKTLTTLQSVQRGQRLRQCRSMARKSLQDFVLVCTCKTPSNLSKYERGELLIAEKNVSDFINALLTFNILCSKEWLLEGIGEKPRDLNENIPSKEGESVYFSSSIRMGLSIFNEIEFFKNNNEGSVIRCISDNLMNPVFHMGDYVGGIPYDETFLPYLNSRYCIAEFPGEVQIVRQLFIDGSTMILTSLNRRCAARQFNFGEVKIFPIVYHRLVFNEDDLPTTSK